MPQIKLYIATTLDGFIAREDGSLDWLNALPNPDKIDHGYTSFLKTIDTVIMGRATYKEILGFGVEWPYPNCHTYILTSDRSYKTTTPKTVILSDLSKDQINRIKERSEKNIWVVGGGKTISSFLNMEEVDEMILSFIPIVLGAGIKLFPDSPRETLFKLVDAQPFQTGVVNLTYKKK